MIDRVLLPVILPLLLLAGCDLPGQPKAGDRYVPPQSIRSFGVLYRQNCAGCHGEDGTLGPAPPINDKLFLALIPDAELKRVIAEGRPGTLMPAFASSAGGQLTDKQVAILTEGIKLRWGSPPAEPAPKDAPPYLADGTGTPEAGAKVFARACAGCHGDDGRDTPDGKGAGPINQPEFLALISDQALRRLAITGRPDLGMPNYADPEGRAKDFKPLSPPEVNDLVALLAHWRKGGSAPARGEMR